MNRTNKERMLAIYKMIHHTLKKRVVFYLKKNKRHYYLLSQNRDLKNILKGKRCFIIGNGPSVKNDDLSKLHDEIVFTVNQSVRNNFFRDINSDFHFWTDPNLFVVDDSSEIDLSIIELMKNVNSEDNRPLCFFPLQQESFIKKYGLDSTLDIRYISPELGWMYEMFSEDIELDKQIPVFGTVIQYAIITAIYMGVSEIYLLGCDNTGIINSVNSLLKVNDDTNYGYSINDTEKVRMQRTAERNGIELDALAYYNDIKSYRLLYRYCTNKGIRLVNCSSQTIIDSIPREKLDNILGKVLIES